MVALYGGASSLCANALTMGRRPPDLDKATVLYTRDMEGWLQVCVVSNNVVATFKDRHTAPRVGTQWLPPDIATSVDYCYSCYIISLNSKPPQACHDSHLVQRQ